MKLYDFGIGLFLFILAAFAAGAATEKATGFLPEVEEAKEQTEGK